MEDLIAKHRKEQRDLQARVTQKRKSASKKTRKAVNDECTALEAELKDRQAAELADFSNGDTPGVLEADNDAALLDAILDAARPEEPSGRSQQVEGLAIDNGNAIAAQRKPNRQKARLARRAAEQEAAVAQAAEEATSLPDLKRRERERMEAEFERLGLKEYEVAANGHCMYLSIADQLRSLHEDQEPIDYKKARASTADYISSHPDDFEAFLEEPLQEYVHKIRDTAEWGGQLELLALAKTYAININVLQADGRIEKVCGADSAIADKEAWLAYYRHGFGLGEHYNSLRKK